MSAYVVDGLSDHNGHYFPTINRDKDAWSDNCVQKYPGGW